MLTKFILGKRRHLCETLGSVALGRPVLETLRPGITHRLFVLWAFQIHPHCLYPSNSMKPPTSSGTSSPNLSGTVPFMDGPNVWRSRSIFPSGGRGHLIWSIDMCYFSLQNPISSCADSVQVPTYMFSGVSEVFSRPDSCWFCLRKLDASAVLARLSGCLLLLRMVQVPGRKRILRQMGAWHLHDGYHSTVTATGTYSTPGLSLSSNWQKLYGLRWSQSYFLLIDRFPPSKSSKRPSIPPCISNMSPYQTHIPLDTSRLQDIYVLDFALGNFKK